LKDVKKEILSKFFSDKAFNKFRKDFRAFWEQTCCPAIADGSRKPSFLLNVEFNGPAHGVTIKCGGTAKLFVSAIVGDFQRHLNEASIGNALVSDLESGAISGRLVLLFSDKPIQVQARDDLLILVAKFLLNECQMTIYGGFLRDWLINNKEATDIDSSFSPGRNLDTIRGTLDAFTRKNGLTWKVENQHQTSVGHLTIIKICKGTIECSVDLLVPTGAPSTSCDADINNIKLHCPNKQLLIEQKVTVPAYTINDSITNIRANQFNCHISFGSNPGYAATRAKKLLSKGFRCLSGIPAVHQNLFTAEEQRLITFA
jgi:hypothetical protein